MSFPDLGPWVRGDLAAQEQAGYEQGLADARNHSYNLMGHDMQGVPVPESEVATGLGFSSVEEFRRWQTDLGHKNLELEHQLKLAQDEARRFQWHGRRGLVVLEKAAEFLRKGCSGDEVDDLLLGIAVVSGKGVDWDHKIDHWFKDVPQ